MEIRTYSELPQTPEWGELLAQSGRTDFFSSRDWYENFTHTVASGDGETAFLAAVDGSERPAAVFPLWIKRNARFPWFIRYGSLTNYYSCLYQPLLAVDTPIAESGLDALIDHLAANRSKWSIVELGPMPEDAWYISRIQTRFSSHGFNPDKHVAFGNWYLEAKDLDFAAYFSSRRKKMRSTVRSKTNQLEKVHSLDIRIINDTDGLEEALDAYNSVYDASWKVPEPYPDFIPGLARVLASRGMLRLGVLTVDDLPAAAQLWFVCNDVAHIFKLAYDPQFSNYSIGTLLTMKLVEYSLDVDHVRAIDFLSGDDEYKRQWMSHRRERVGIRIINGKSIGGMGLNVRHFAGQIKRRLLSIRN